MIGIEVSTVLTSTFITFLMLFVAYRVFLSPVYRSLKIMSRGATMSNLSAGERKIFQTAVEDLTSSNSLVGNILTTFFPKVTQSLKKNPAGLISILKVVPMVSGFISSFRVLKANTEKAQTDQKQGVY